MSKAPSYKKSAAPQQWPADAVERRAIAASIREWGWTTPVLVGEDSTIIAGHGARAGRAEAWLAEVPVMVARGWTEAQKRAYVLADNKLALNAGWDDDLLQASSLAS
jgi:ParB-like chromosome segregation protein Spo0J